MSWNLPDLLLSQLYLTLSVETPQPTRYHKLKVLLRNYVRKKGTNTSDLLQSHVDVVFWPTEPNHLDQMFPVADLMIKNGFSVLFVTNKKKILSLLRATTYPFYYLRGILASSYSIAKVIQKDLTSITAVVSNLIGHNSTKVLGELSRSIPELANLITFTKHLINQLQPVVFMVGYDITIEGRVAARICAQHRVFNCAIQHGEMSSPLNSYHVVDTYFVFGSTVKRRLEKLNGRTKFYITGPPYLDARKKGVGILTNIPLKLAMREGLPYVLVCFSGPGNNTSFKHHAQMVETLFLLHQQRNNINIVVKLHPKDKFSFYSTYLKKYTNATIRVVESTEEELPKSIFDWLYSSSLLITGGSMVAIEAMALGIPVISLDILGEYSHIEFIQSGACISVTDASGLVAAVDNLLSNPNAYASEKKRMAGYVKEYFYEPPEGAAQCCVDYLVKRMKCAE